MVYYGRKKNFFDCKSIVDCNDVVVKKIIDIIKLIYNLFWKYVGNEK